MNYFSSEKAFDYLSNDIKLDISFKIYIIIICFENFKNLNSKSPNRLNFEGTQLGILIKKQLQVFSIKNKKEKKNMYVCFLLTFYFQKIKIFPEF